MKFTLESFPEYDPDTMTHLQYWEKVQAWVIGCKQELRALLVHPTNTESIEVYDFVKQILGEDCSFEPKIKEETKR
jgi:hypothetical protein